MPKLQINPQLADPTDQTQVLTIIGLGEPVANINAIRVQDMKTMTWYTVYPEGAQAYVTPGTRSGHIVFGAINYGGVDGDLWGKLTDDTGRVLIPQTYQWCQVGLFVYWEIDFDMPSRNYTLYLEVGH